MNNSPNFLESCEMLGLNPDELMLSPTLTDNTPDSVRKRIKQLNAATKLSICMMAWNKIDEFEPDENAVFNQKNVGYIPYFYYKDGRLFSSGYASYGSSAGLVNATALHAAATTYATFGLRLSFITRDRAVAFGETFIEIFNELI